MWVRVPREQGRVSSIVGWHVVRALPRRRAHRVHTCAHMTGHWLQASAPTVMSDKLEKRESLSKGLRAVGGWRDGGKGESGTSVDAPGPQTSRR